jgi:hypothetical protein
MPADVSGSPSNEERKQKAQDYGGVALRKPDDSIEDRVVKLQAAYLNRASGSQKEPGSGTQGRLPEASGFALA